MSRLLLNRAFVCAVSVLAVLRAQADDVGSVGSWNGPLGEVTIVEEGGEIVGRMASESRVCSFAADEVVLRGTQMSGSLAGSLRFCLQGCPQAGEDVWAFSMLVIEDDRIAGATHVVDKGCAVPGRGENGAVVFERARSETKGRAIEPVGPRMPEGVYDPRGNMTTRDRALQEARVGAALLEQGRFEAARARFEAAVAIDPDYAEGFNGIGVTHALRREWSEAVEWYRRSIAVGPFIGDAYYNLACAYAQSDEPVLAVRYLQLAVLNGYAQIEHLSSDSDLAPLRDREDFRSVLALGAASSAAASSSGDPVPRGDQGSESNE